MQTVQISPGESVAAFTFSGRDVPWIALALVERQLPERSREVIAGG